MSFVLAGGVLLLALLASIALDDLGVSRRQKLDENRGNRR
jgi:hypothetical protein